MTHTRNIYINAISSLGTMQHDIRQLIPNAMQRRRMSDIVRQGVAVGMECMLNAGETAEAAEAAENLDAIITATGFGCLADSEKFLENVIATDEQLLSPTPFIQSTFNTIGGQLAIMLHSHAVNVTYSQRTLSFESALLDAVLQLTQGEAENILVGAFELDTPTLLALMSRMGIDVSRRTDGVCYFLLSTHKTAHSIATLSLQLPAPSETEGTTEAADTEEKNTITVDISSDVATAAALHQALCQRRIPCTIFGTRNRQLKSIIRIQPC